jgi:hypothetical protein
VIDCFSRKVVGWSNAHGGSEGRSGDEFMNGRRGNHPNVHERVLPIDDARRARRMLTISCPRTDQRHPVWRYDADGPIIWRAQLRLAAYRSGELGVGTASVLRRYARSPTAARASA